MKRTRSPAARSDNHNLDGVVPMLPLEVPERAANEQTVKGGAGERLCTPQMHPTAQQLQSRKALLSKAAKMAHLGWWDYDIATGRLDWSDETLSIFGISRQSFGNRLDDFIALVHPDDVPATLAGHGKSLATGQPVEMEYRIRRPDGDVRHVWDCGETILGRDGKPVRRAGVLIDITERKIVETQILKLSAAVEQTPDRVLITALDGRIEYVNPAFERATGYKAREVLGRSPAILKSGAHSPEFYRTMWKTILAGRTFKAEFTNRRRDGSMLFEEQTITPLRDQKGNVTHFISTGRDISEWKRTCAALRESEDRHRLLFESPQPIWVFDLESLRFLAVNPAAVALYGFSEEEFLGMTLTDIRPEEDIPEFLSAVRTFAATVSVPGFDSSELVNVGVTRHKAKDGRILDVEIRSRPITCQGRSAAIVLPTDITERLKSERSLRECQERFRQLSENVKEVFWIQDLATDRLLYVSPSFDRIWGRQHTSMQTSKDFLETVHPEDRDAVVNYFRSQRSCGCHEHTYRITRPDGDVRWIHNKAYPILEEGKAQRVVGTSEDITDRVARDNALRFSEERFRLLSKATNDAIWDWDLVTNRIWWNDGFETLFGFDRTQVGDGIECWTNRVHPEDRERVLKTMQSQMESPGNEHCEVEYRFLRKDGSFAWVFDRGHFFRDDKGRIVRMIGGMSDITARKEAEERVREQAILLDIASEGILVKDLSGKVLYWNKGAERIFGWTGEEALGCSAMELFKTDAAVLDLAMKRVIDTGEWRGDMPARTKDGAEITINVRWTLVRETDGEPKAVFSIISDVTENKQVERQLLRAQRMESIGTLAGGIAHDLNNVLAPILMSIELLKDEIKGSAGTQLLSTIQSSALRGAELVKQVLGFARGMDGKRVPINPLHVAREIQRIVRDTFPKKIEFTLSADKALWCLNGDPTQLHQVLMNLCVNARDAMPNGGKIDVSLENVHLDEVFASQHPQASAGPHVLLSVADTGVGIPKEHLDRIFEPFFTTKEDGHGTGLGLSTTMAIVKSHGGFVSVVSKKGKGSTFKVYLPSSIGPSPKETPAEPSQIAIGKGELVLVVDDEAALREIAKAALERNGYRAIVAANGAEAVAAYAREPKIEAALIDMTMPVMDGVSTILALRQLNPKLGIVASSGISSSEDVAKPLAAGANCFLAKPFTAENLLANIQNVLTTAA